MIVLKIFFALIIGIISLAHLNHARADAIECFKREFNVRSSIKEWKQELAGEQLVDHIEHCYRTNAESFTDWQIKMLIREIDKTEVAYNIKRRAKFRILFEHLYNKDSEGPRKGEFGVNTEEAREKNKQIEREVIQTADMMDIAMLKSVIASLEDLGRYHEYDLCGHFETRRRIIWYYSGWH
jgi:hypothetical protein